MSPRASRTQQWQHGASARTAAGAVLAESALGAAFSASAQCFESFRRRALLPPPSALRFAQERPCNPEASIFSAFSETFGDFSGIFGKFLELLGCFFENFGNFLENLRVVGGISGRILEIFLKFLREFDKSWETFKEKEFLGKCWIFIEKILFQ